MKYLQRGTLNIIQAEKVERLIYLANHNWRKTPTWFVRAYERGLVIITHDCIFLNTEYFGIVRCDIGDWIICDSRGNLIPVDDDIFQRGYKFLAPLSNAV